MNRCCLELLGTPELEEKIVDMLLVESGTEVFTTAPSFTHGLHHALLDPLEKVLGRDHSVSIRLLMTQEQARELVQRLRERFPGSGVRYWISPVLEEGEIL